MFSYVTYRLEFAYSRKAVQTVKSITELSADWEIAVFEIVQFFFKNGRVETVVSIVESYQSLIVNVRTIAMSDVDDCHVRLITANIVFFD
jgi:nucleosome binding factor SPN SPT16 subunit